jgi:hypothetical protein
MPDSLYDRLGHVIPARASAQMAGEREPLLSGPVPVCSVPGCLWEVRADGLCVEHLEVREISRPYGLDPRELQLADDCLCLIHKKTGVVVQPCESHQRQVDREASA